MASGVLDPPLAAESHERAFLGIRMRPVEWALLVALWMIPGLITTWLFHYVRHEEWSVAIFTQLPPWLYWVPVTPLIVQLARARPLDAGVWKKSLPVHILGTLVFAAMQIGTAAASCKTFGGVYCREEPAPKLLFGLFSYYAELNVVCYWGIVALGSAIDYHRRFRDREIANARLETQLVQAQLEALKMQLQPHFLFNTLHAIGVLVRKGDQQGSIRMLAGVSDLLRISLENVGKQEVPLKDELDFVDRYVDVERTRFQDRLAIKRSIAPETLDALLPNLILQPIVENAIRHGIESRAEGGTISITSKRDAEQLVLTVEDDGVGLGKSSTAPGRGVGLSNVRARLDSLHPGRYTLRIEDRAAAGHNGVCVTMAIPFRGGTHG